MVATRLSKRERERERDEVAEKSRVFAKKREEKQLCGWAAE